MKMWKGFLLLFGLAALTTALSYFIHNCMNRPDLHDFIDGLACAFWVALPLWLLLSWNGTPKQDVICPRCGGRHWPDDCPFRASKQ